MIFSTAINFLKSSMRIRLLYRNTTSIEYRLAVCNAKFGAIDRTKGNMVVAVPCHLGLPSDNCFRLRFAPAVGRLDYREQQGTGNAEMYRVGDAISTCRISNSRRSDAARRRQPIRRFVKYEINVMAKFHGTTLQPKRISIRQAYQF